MRLSQYFIPVLKENPKEAQIVSHRLMLRAGMIQQSSAGIYSWLPMGLKVLSKIQEYTQLLTAKCFQILLKDQVDIIVMPIH